MNAEFKIWFAEGPRARDHFWNHPWRWRLKLIIKHTNLVAYLFGSELIKLIQRGHLSHTLIEYDGVVLDPMFSGNRYWDIDSFLSTYPGRRVFFRFTTDAPVDIACWETEKKWGLLRELTWGTLFRFILFFSRGRIRFADDCVSIACKTLKKSGVDVPIHVFTPKKLITWLKEEGYALTAHASTRTS
jgi:hypothetical protein